MARTTVPKRSAVSYGTLVTDFNENTDINVVGAVTSPLGSDEGTPNTGGLVDTSWFLSGASSVKCTIDGPAGDGFVQIRVNLPMDLSQAKTVYVWLKRNSETEANTADNNDLVVTLRCFTDAFNTVTNNYKWADTAGSRAAKRNAPPGVILYAFDVELPDMTEGGSPTGLDQIQWFWLEIDGPAAQIVDCNLDGVYIDTRARPKALVSIDDGFESDYLKAYEIMYNERVAESKRPLLATSNIISEDMAGGTKLTEAQATTMYGNGWDISDHSSDDTIPGDIDKFIACRTYLDGLGFTRSSGYIAYPGNNYDNDLIRQVQAAGFKAARGRNATSAGAIAAPSHIGHPDAPEQWPYNQYAFPLTIAFDSAEYGADGATIKFAIDQAIKAGRTCIIMIHEIVAAGAAGNQTDEADFRAIINYLELRQNQGVVDIVTMSQWYEGLVGGGRALVDRTTA